MKTSAIKDRFAFEAKVWLYHGMAGWHFITLPAQESAQIKALFAGMAKSWGSLPVAALIGRTSWNTSIFPDKKSDAYLLPLKADIRKKENIAAGDTVRLVLDIRLGDMYWPARAGRKNKEPRDPS